MSSTADILEETAAIYADLVEKHRRPPPVQPSDITIEQFAQDIGASIDAARVVLEREAKQGALEKVRRLSANNRPCFVYHVKEHRDDQEA